MKHLLGVLGHLSILCALVVAPPPRNANRGAGEHPTQSVTENVTEQEDLNRYAFHYSKYLEKVVKILETDPQFRQKMATMSEQEMKEGKLADHFDVISDTVIHELTKEKLIELERLREMIAAQMKADGGAHNLQQPEHIDLDKWEHFGAEDLRKLILKTVADMDKVDEQRKENFKRYELEKQAKFDHETSMLAEEEKNKKIKEHEDAKKRHEEHEKLNHPGDRKQLEEVWEEKDKMDKDSFDPKTFFALHDINGDGYWNNEEIDALFQLELAKVYNDTNPDDDPREKIEEMYRMREHVVKQMDKNSDRLISLQEFLSDSEVNSSTPAPNEDWKDLAQQNVYTDEELKQFESEYAKENGWVDEKDITTLSTPAPTTTTPLPAANSNQQPNDVNIHPQQANVDNNRVDPMMGI
uniref:EF-hand domain-containing protein n=1 Tax=Rhabditophanes sp. KR3021 TaxID=114890 RepID=A0AC35U6Z9_9BILA